MDIKNFEQKLYNLLLNHLNGKYIINEYLELLEQENNSFLNYILSHAYAALNDTDNADKYRKIAVELNSNFDFDEDYKNIFVYIFYLFSTITTQIPPFIDDEIEKWIEHNPTPDEFLKVSEAYRTNNNISNALSVTQKGLEKFPKNNSLIFDIASNLLYTRNFYAAWEYNELRFDAVRPKLPQYINKPKFNLQTDSANVYIYPVTKLGDTVFFARYLFKLKQDYPKLNLFFSPDKQLAELFEDNGIKTCEKPDEHIIDYQISIEGLPYLFKNTSTQILTNGYLKANKEKASLFKQQFFSNNKIKAGIVWNSSKPDSERNLPIKLFEDLFKIQNIQFYSLQKEISLPDELFLSSYCIPNLGRKLNNFSDTAAIIDNLDIIIGCDTSVTNLSGAMGKNTIIILPFHSDWRWGLFEQNSKWYDSVKLYRKKQNQDYEEVFARVKKYLETCKL
jgi:hypothetical protein